MWVPTVQNQEGALCCGGINPAGGNATRDEWSVTFLVTPNFYLILYQMGSDEGMRSSAG